MPGRRRSAPRTVTWTAGSAGTDDIRHSRAAEPWLSTAPSPQASTAASQRPSSRSAVCATA